MLYHSKVLNTEGEIWKLIHQLRPKYNTINLGSKFGGQGAVHCT